MDEDRQEVLLIIDYQKGFLNDNSKRIIKPLTKLLHNKKFDKVIMTMWFNSGVNNFTECLNYENCQVDGKDAGLIKLYHGSSVYPRVNRYSCLTEEMLSILKYNMHIYLCGLETDACVLGTAFGLFDYGFKFNIIDDCTTSKNKELEDAARLIINRQFGVNTFIRSTDLYIPKKFGIF